MTYRFVFFLTALFITQVCAAQLFGEQQIVSTQDNGPVDIHTADLDGDGDADLLVAPAASNVLTMYENLGGGIFGPRQFIHSPLSLVSTRSVYTADIDGDGDPDILSASSNDDKIAWHENLGQLTFGDQQVISTEAHAARSVYSADLDNDGDMDVLSASLEDDKIAWYENLGEGLFGEQQVISLETDAAMSVHSADLDNDGDMDVLSASHFDGKIAWYENLGEGLFSDQQIISSESTGAFDVFTADLDDDGDVDVLTASWWGYNIAWHENMGGGEFGEQQIITEQLDHPTSVYAADLDADGDLDVLSSSALDNKIAWYENLDGSSFGDQQIISVEAETAWRVHADDLDGDGAIDVLSVSGVDDKIAWYKNLSYGCTDPSACNFEPSALFENNSCCYLCDCYIVGANNYNALACHDDGSCRFPITGTVFFDENENGVMDGDDYGLPLQEVELLPTGLSLTTNDNGHFSVDASGSDEFTFELEQSELFPFFTSPPTLTLDATQDNWNQDTLYFGVSNEIPAFDLEVDLYSLVGGFPCNGYRTYYLCFRNTSNNTVDIQVEFHYDTLFQDIAESSLIDSVGENVAYLSFTDVAPMELVCPQVHLLSPTVEFIGEFLETSIEVTAFYDGEEVAFGADSLSEELTCAYDPNDKQVFPIGYSEEHYIANDTTLEYLIRFQNTGNAPATDVIVRDTLDEHLDISTFQLRVSSHSVFTTLDPASREVEFYFQDIMLADSVNNEPESHGLVSFNISPEADLPLLTELNNTAAIYFDNNPPIITNTTWSTIYDCSLFEVSFTDDGALLTASEGDHYQWFLNGEPIEGATEQEHTALENGNYSVQVDNDFPCSDNSTSTFIVVTSIQNWEGQQIKLFPNPMTTSATLDLGELRGPIQVEIYDILGKLHRSEVLSVESGTLTLKRGDLTKGVYILRLTLVAEPVELKFLVE